VAVPNRFAGAFSSGEIKARGIAMRRSDTPPMVAALQRELLERMAAAETIADLRAMLTELRGITERAVAELREGRIPPEALAIARRLSKAPEQYVANTAAAAVTRELCGRGVTLRPGSKIRYLLADGKGRAMGFLDGNETPDFPRYEEMLREAEEELLGPFRRKWF
jgi:DNA polymerase elongation subunit (family B)